ncbi:replication termination factor 2 isoform X2 [Oratosquilla oratoria]|uniref:replication termination factor 2 isoform X2 n=1 Tax=Oratosquilla oratoria TaxID=337810 RepID=UPI003F75F32D
MGCDGGTIPRRDELVKTKKKPEQKDKTSDRMYRWRHCAMSQARLQRPIVGCELGRLYNKEAVLTRLLDRHHQREVTGDDSHIRMLRDIKELRLTANPGYALKRDVAQKGDAYVDHQVSEFMCPVTGLEMNGKYPFVFMWTCGCVVSERAMKEVPSEVCHKCGKPIRKEDVIPINPTSQEVLDQLRSNMAARRARDKAAKKEKRESKRTHDYADEEDEVEPEVEEEEECTKEKSSKVQKTSGGGGPSSSSSSSSSSGSGAKPRVNSAVSALLKDEDFQHVRSSGFSVAKNPEASEVYKSIFDTHKTAKNRPNPHWVTCNPQYF